MQNWSQDIGDFSCDKNPVKAHKHDITLLFTVWHFKNMIILLRKCLLFILFSWLTEHIVPAVVTSGKSRRVDCGIQTVQMFFGKTFKQNGKFV